MKFVGKNEKYAVLAQFSITSNFHALEFSIGFAFPGRHLLRDCLVSTCCGLCCLDVIGEGGGVGMRFLNVYYFVVRLH